MPTTYKNYYELGQAVQAKNPDLADMDPWRVGRLYHKKHPTLVQVERISGDPLPFPGTDVALPSPMDMMGSVLQPGGTVDNLLQGITSGATLGGMEQVHRAFGSEPPSGFAYEAGEVLGEIAGPYRLLHNALSGMGMVQRTLQSAPQLGRVVLSGVESGLVEGAKGAIQLENPAGHLAQGLIVGALPEGMVRIGGRLVRKGAARLLKPAAEDVDMGLVELFKKYGLPTIPSIFRPESGVIDYFERRFRQTSSTRSQLQAVRKQLTEGLQNMREKLIASFGDGVVVEDPLQAGQSAIRAIAETERGLFDSATQLYKDLANTNVGRVDIDPELAFERILPDGTRYSATLLGDMQQIISGIDPKGDLTPSSLKKLVKFVSTIREELVPPTPPPRFKQGQGEEGIMFLQDLGEQEAPDAVYHDYKWWWDKLQEIGTALQSPAVKKNGKVKAKYSAMYALVQDAIDAQAASVSPEYNQIVTHARSRWTAYKTFSENEVVKAVDRTDRLNPERALDVLFGSTAQVQEAKALLGPEAFNSARQAWLRGLLWDTVVDDALSGTQYVSGRRIASKLDKYTDGIDSEYLRAVFSDEGYRTIDGQPIRVDTGAKEKFEQFLDLVEVSRHVDTALQGLRGGQEQLSSASIERAPISTWQQDIIANKGQRTRALLANILTTKRGASMYFEPYDRNIFMGQGQLPELGDLSTRLPFTDQTIPMSSISSAILNRPIGAAGR